MHLVHAGQEVCHGGANVGATVRDNIGILRRANVVAQRYERRLLEVRHGLAYKRIRSTLVTRKHQEARRQGGKRIRVHAAWANEGEGGYAIGMSRSEPSPVSSTTGRDVGARDTQVLEKLHETFFYRTFDFCHYPTLLWSEYDWNPVAHWRDAVL